MTNAIHIIRSLDPRSGGTSVSVPALVKAIASTGRYNQRLLCFHGKGECSAISIPEVEVICLPWDPAGLWFGKARRAVLEFILQSDLVHIHGIWQAHCAAAGGICRRANKPFLASAHGMLEPWALRNKRWKKSPYSALVERRNLRAAACLRALTESEISDYRRYGLSVPAALIPNGIDLPSSLDPAAFYLKYPGLAGKRLVLFLSRVHYKKGVDTLCRAWASVARDFPNAHLVVAGPDFEGTLAKVEALVAKLHLKDRVTFTGMLGDADKWAALAAAECFVLPSHSEGFSVAVLEALAASLPVIVTPGCNFPEVAQTGCGRIVAPEVEKIACALRTLLNCAPQERAAMGRRGRELVESRYAWPAIGARMAAVNDWVLGDAPAPDDVFCS